ncbi:Ribonuclease P protein subunit rpr2 [Escovopsis weberi]|uniref:Ribonuclease P protein subunit rpr2 n=1 Tax=Escovopsis weberi TaxID=150374 RepID=A0A0M8N0W8_ESCWE|nr:Ribonuclease P protein subunit rpr2 [Escovopsis weberi]
MAKAKAKAKGAASSVQNRHIYTRASYLYQAASYLASRSLSRAPEAGGPSEAGDAEDGPKKRQALMNTSRRFVSDMRSITLKTQIRCTPAVKRSICKFCDTLQIEGTTCRSVVENASRGGRKPWADVLVVRCQTCGNAKRFPVGAAKQTKRGERAKKPEGAAEAPDVEDRGLRKMSIDEGR